MHFVGARRDFYHDRGRSIRNETLHAHSPRNRKEVARPKPMYSVRRNLEVAHCSVCDHFILGYDVMPVRLSIVVGIVAADDPFDAFISEKRSVRWALQISYEEDMLCGR